MAFRGTELMVIVRGQNYASQMLRRVAADVRGLQAVADSSTLNQDAIQSRIVANAEKTAKIQRDIHNSTSRIAANRSLIEAQQAANALQFTQRKAALANREQTLLNGIAAKNLQIEKSQQNIAKATTGSTALNNQLKKTNLEGQALSLGQQRIALANRENGLESQRLKKTAQRIGYEEKLKSMGFRRNMSQERLVSMAATGSPAERIIASRMLATRIDLQTIDKLQKDFPAEIAAWEAKVASLSGKEQVVLKQLDEAAGSVSMMTKQLANQEAELARIQERLVAIRGEYETIAAREGVMNAQVSKQLAALQTEEASLKLKQVRYAELVAEGQKLRDVDLEDAKALDAQNAALANRQRFQKTMMTTAAVGRAAQFGGLIGTGVLGATALSAAHFDTQLSLAATQMANTPKEIAAARKSLGNEILKQMTQFPASSKEMADSAYSIFSSIPALTGAGPKGFQKGYKLLELANKMSVAGQTTLTDSTNILVRAINNFSKSGETADQVANSLFATVKYGNLHLSDFTSILSNLGTSAITAHQSLNDLLGPISVLSEHMTAPQLSTGLSRVLNLMSRSNFIEGAQGPGGLGVQVTDAAGKQLLPIMQIVDNFIAKFGTLKQGGIELTNLFKRTTAASGQGIGNQGTVAALKTIGILFTRQALVHLQSEQIAKDNQELARSFSVMSQTSGVKWAIFMNMMKSTAIQIGTTVIPVFQKIGGDVSAIVHWFDRLSPSTRSVIGQFAAWSAIGLLLGGTLVHIIGTIGSLIGYMRVMMGMKALQQIEGEALAAEGAVLGLKGALLGIAGTVAVATIVLTIIPENKHGQRILHQSALGRMLDKVPLGRKLAEWGAAFGDSKGGKILHDALFDPLNLGHEKSTPNPARDKGGWIKGSAYDQLYKIGLAGGNMIAPKSNPNFAALKQAYQDGLNARKAEALQVKANTGLFEKYAHAIAQAQLQAEKSGSASDWLKYSKLQIEAQKKLTPAQIQAIDLAGTKLAGNDNSLLKSGQLTGKQYQAALSSLKDLYKIALTAPAGSDQSVQAWQVYYQALDALKSTSTKAQYKAAEAELEAEKKLLDKSVTAHQSAANAIASAQQKMANQVKTVIEKLETVFNNFQTANETMFGELGTGRVMQGPIGQVYSQLAQFNIAPPFKYLLQDQKSQIQDFKTYRSDLEKIERLGGKKSHLMIDELKALGPQGRLLVHSLAGAGKAGVQAYLKGWGEKKSLIQDATKVDFKNQLTEWESYGKKVMWAILTGLKSQSQFLRKGFQKYILSDTLEDSFKTWINREFPNLMANAAKDAIEKWKAKQAAKTRAQKQASATGGSKTTNNTVSYTTHLHVHGSPSESLHAAGRRLLFEHQVGTRRRGTVLV